ncbi:F-box/kelch-repeat protein At1g16250 [Manihot esculenta]|uniref:F-box domain-containing protein n=1 Tax=Manihot esculenta TaxID=3983 RepID=A0A2C9UT51_MANES|nr:F-box/kelch-repeat protein At1g16250 [Manihot esculenta]OAY34096.1 hypothetical protein MANES_13G149600v8 [Manihot esculenta]
MASLSSQLPLQPSQENPPSNYSIYASFCCRDASPNTNMSIWIECYSPSINAWHRITRIPGLIENHVLKGFSMASIGDSIYIIGGRLCHKLPGHVHDELDLEVRSSVLRYNVRDNEWHKCASLSTPRFDFACTVSDNKIYVAGGKCALACPRGISSAEVYDPALDEWKALPNMSTMRYKCVGVTWQGKIHVVGGFAERDNSYAERPWHILERCSAEVYDSEHEKWDLVLGMWQLDVPPNQIVAVSGNLFSSGDCLNAWKGHIEAYDGKQNMWNEVDGSHLETLSSPISTSDATEENWPPIQRLYLTMAPIGTHLYFLAGYRLPGEISRSMSVVHVFDTSANEYGWRSFEPMEEEGEKELCSHCCVVRQTL